MMRLTHPSTCSGCGDRRLSRPYRISRQPVVLNYRCTTAVAAAGVPRRDLRLVQCGQCGLIFNETADAKLIPYDANYENRQCFSPAFRAHLERLADLLDTRYCLRGKRVLEVGCGKGDFLELLCQRAQAAGVGYDTSCDEQKNLADAQVQLFPRYVTAKEIATPFDLVICRHVVEHVTEIGNLLRELYLIAKAAGNAVTVIETPAFEWIAEQVAFWDIFYEHANYFTKPCLAWLCRKSGFRILRHRLMFGKQYQVLELACDSGVKPLPGIRAMARLPDFAARAEARVASLEQRLKKAGAKHGWAIWGAGAKGVSLVNRLRKIPPLCVIDSNPAKQGCFIPGSRVPVVAPNDPRISRLGVVLIANPNYEAEIVRALREIGFCHTILSTQLS